MSVNNALLGRMRARLVRPTCKRGSRENKCIVLRHLTLDELSRKLIISERALFIDRRISTVPNTVQPCLKLVTAADASFDSCND